jgi:hydrogenase maturation protein HypF
MPEHTTAHAVRRTVDITGTVQGVGFRPTMFRLASAAGLTGWVQNRSGTVRMALEGERGAIDAFMRELPGRIPAGAAIHAVTVIGEHLLADRERHESFAIVTSDPDDPTGAVIPPDLAICPRCLRDTMTPGSRRFGYPFTTCADCGPRYSLIDATPYDRERTTMRVFPMCPDCTGEYTDKADRRFHAESIACPACGPGLWIEPDMDRTAGGDALRLARRAIADGQVVALRSIGGFHLAVDAFAASAIRTLRERKHRPSKPFAVMADSMRTVRRLCRVTPEAEALLLSPQAPIVIMDIAVAAAQEAGLPVELLSPDADTLGVMLPPSPLHHLVFHPLPGDPTPAFRLLVMTSGNRGGEPICITNNEARERLRGIADVLLLHNREINLRVDDSICVVRRGKPQVWRRARGFAPAPVRLAHPLQRTVLAMGAEIKNAVALAFDSVAVLSPHIGDLETPEALDSLESTASALPRFFGRKADCIAVDMHPDMHATRLGVRLAAETGARLVRVQHHHAHALSCLAENGRGSGLALVLDGTGYGPDGSVWGAELLDVDGSAFTRLATFSPVPLPGGDAAVRHPVRQLLARWLAAGVRIQDDWLAMLDMGEELREAWLRTAVSGAPMAHSAGRLFDSMSALLGAAPRTVTYEGQAAVRLEAMARRAETTGGISVPFSTSERDRVLLVDWAPAFALFSERPPARGGEPCVALAFHDALVRACLAMVEFGLSHSRHRDLVLSGGVFMNRILCDALTGKLKSLRVNVLTHGAVPPNDGGIALGQAVAGGC